MGAQLYSFAAGLISFLLYTAVFLILRRLHLKIGWLASQVIAGSVIHILSSIFSACIINGFLYWYALGVFAVCWFFFFTLSTAIYVSISARILRTISRQRDHSISLEEVFRLCILKPFQERAEFLVDSGLAQKGKIGFRITDTGAKSARRLQAMRDFFGMEGSGLYSLDRSIKIETKVKK